MTTASLIKCHAVAFYFAQQHEGCAAKEIADVFEMPLNSVYHLAKQPEFDVALDALNFEGDRKFTKKKTRDPRRDDAELVAQTRSCYLMERRKGLKHTRAVSEVSNFLDVDRRRVNDWYDRYNWEADLLTEDEALYKAIADAEG